MSHNVKIICVEHKNDSIKIKEIGDTETYNLCQNGSFVFAFIQNISIGEILTDFTVGKANGIVTHFYWDIKQVRLLFKFELFLEHYFLIT